MSQNNPYAQDPVQVYTEHPADTRFFDGALPHGQGVWNMQIMRANRSQAQADGSPGHTYNHAPMLCYWRGHFFVEYLSGPKNEHENPSKTWICRSANGIDWNEPETAFPSLPLPEGVYTGPGAELLRPGDHAVMHQRMGFYVAQSGRLYVLGFYGVCPKLNINPNNGYGIARVIREVREDFSLSPIYVIRYNTAGGFAPEHVPFPFYQQAEEPFVKDCEELLANPLVIRQWWEEQRFDTELFPQSAREAFCWYHAADGKIVGMYKHGNVAISEDEGKTFSAPQVCHSIGTGNGKMWGQKTADGRYALIYHPTPDGMHRWPLALTLSEDGYHYRGLSALTIHVPPTRYEGWAKNLGPQYVRGITENNPAPADDNLWLTYSMNKEDIWVCRAALPLDATPGYPDEDLAADAPHWNVYSPYWAPVRFCEDHWSLSDAEPYDKAIAQRTFPASERLALTTCVCPQTNGCLYIDLTGEGGTMPIRLVFRPDGMLYVKSSGAYQPAIPYAPGERYTIAVQADCLRHQFTLRIHNEQTMLWEKDYRFSCQVKAICGITYQTKDRVNPYDLESNGKDSSMSDLPDADTPIEKSEFFITSLKVNAQK